MKNYLIIGLFIYAVNIFSQIPTNGLIGYYPFTGNANDFSANGNNGVVNGAILTTNRFGTSNSAYLFSNSTDNITIPTISLTDVLTYSVTGWFQKSSASENAEGTIYSSSNPCNGPGGLRFTIGTTNQAVWGSEYQDCSSMWSITNNQNYSDDIWHSFVVTFNATPGLINATQFKIYIDNVLVPQSEYSQGNLNNVLAPINNQNLATTIGNAIGGVSTNFQGKLDDIRIYNRGLNESEIEILHNENTKCKKIALFFLRDTNGNHLEMEVSSDTWHYLAFTKASDLSGKIFLDGNLVASGNFDNLNYNYSQLYLGVDFFTTWTSFYRGWIDEFRVSNTVRSDSEILANYQSNSPLIVDGNTLGLWHFDESSGSQFVNSANGLSGDLYNGVSFQTGMFSNAVYFDGIDDRGNCNINIPEYDLTFEIWIKIEGESENVGRTIFQAYGAYNTNALIFDDCGSTLSDKDIPITQSIKIYPNPVADILSIESDNPINKVEIYSSIGKKLNVINSDFKSIHTDNLSTGIYIIKIYIKAVS